MDKSEKELLESMALLVFEHCEKIRALQESMLYQKVSTCTIMRGCMLPDDTLKEMHTELFSDVDFGDKDLCFLRSISRLTNDNLNR